MKHPTALIILDGFGYRKEKEYNAIAQAQTPHLDGWFAHYPHTLLNASGTAVGLPDAVIGNSEVGHITIGTGRIIEQPITILNNAIADRSFFKNPTLVHALTTLRKTGNALHIMGLLSDGNVHSEARNLYAFIDAAHQHGIKYLYIHPFLDGRDAPPKSARTYLDQLDNALTAFEYGSIGSIHGRFYAMDRDNHWDRTQKSYNVLTENQDYPPRPWQDVLESQYAQGITDEFIVPTQIDPTSTIQKGDGVIFFNVRPDRARQITACFVDPHFNHFPVKKLNLTCFVTPVDFGNNLKTNGMYPHTSAKNTLKDVLAHNGKTIFSIAETEKYAHVTYFFNDGREEAERHETRVIIPSLPTQNYLDNPQMSAPQITHAVLESLTTNPGDFYLINYANADMVGHSGDLQATIRAVECLDEQLSKLYEVIVKKMHGTMYITADHGNAEDKYDPISKQPRTAHTANPVPFLMIQDGLQPDTKLPLTQLSDVAPWILENMGLSVPEDMGKVERVRCTDRTWIG